MKVKRFRNGLVFVSLLMAVMFFLTFSSTAMATNYYLTIKKATSCTAGNASGSVTLSDGTSKTCSSYTCAFTVTSGVTAKIYVNGTGTSSGSGYVFTGCDSKTGNTCTVKMTSAKTITFCY